MTAGRLSALQVTILSTVAEVQPPWVLAGGAALVGFHVPHRTTRDLDLFWHGLSGLGRIPADVADVLGRAGLEVATLQSSPSFSRLAVRSAGEACTVDLVAVPASATGVLDAVRLGESTILVESAQQLLVAKLCALLGRSELRDLQDVKALVESGRDLEAAVLAAPALDGGFSPLILARLLDTFPVVPVSQLAGLAPSAVADLAVFRDRLVERLLRLAAAE